MLYAADSYLFQGEQTFCVEGHTIGQGSHASWKVLDIFVKFPVPEKFWKMILVLENPGN